MRLRNSIARDDLGIAVRILRRPLLETPLSDAS